ncbi:MAG: CCA tRNA nucleotidyltransferase [Planctomyces sp.]|nr:CCA tRNA nucleotidyltransferase [Planctomyces sp.]
MKPLPDNSTGLLCARRTFALDVVQRLRHAGFEALWAGGCVRDQLLGKQPKDYDVASTARPEQVINLFGVRRTVPVGASFGVVMVLGPGKAAGQIEVATFRSDGAYMDGRRPVGVRFCSAEEDAQRRDFTINGMFYDPVQETVIDYVGGQKDLAAGIIRAIGDANARFTEDKLRMLRAIRFAATLRFSLEPATFAAIQSLHTQITQVSIERIAQEVRRMLSDKSRGESIKLLQSSGLLRCVLPEAEIDSEHVTKSASVLNLLQVSSFEPSLAAILLHDDPHHADLKERSVVARDTCRRLRLSNEETETIVWLLTSLDVFRTLPSQPPHVVRPLLADERIPLLIDLSSATEASYGRLASGAAAADEMLSADPSLKSLPRPLVTGNDLLERGIPGGPRIREVLTQLRNEQLDGLLADRAAAIQRLDELLQCDW